MIQLNMAPNQKRWRFVIVLSGLATIYGTILAYRLLYYQSDAISDILKMSGLIFVVSLILSYVWWSVVTTRLSGAKGGAVAAVLTAISIIPVPTFAGAFKGEFLVTHNLISSVRAGLTYSLSTFSAAEALALPLCAIAGYVLAR